MTGTAETAQIAWKRQVTGAHNPGHFEHKEALPAETGGASFAGIAAQSRCSQHMIHSKCSTSPVTVPTTVGAGCYGIDVLNTTTKTDTKTPKVSLVASSFLSVSAASAHSHKSSSRNRSVLFCTSVMRTDGNRPGTEVRAKRDSDHGNFIIAGRNVA